MSRAPATPTDASGSDLSGFEPGRSPPAGRVRLPWLRVRLIALVSAMTITVALVLDLVVGRALPQPAEVGALQVTDVLLFTPLLVAVVALVVLVELRVVSAALRTLRLGLRLTEGERRRATRTARSFPVLLPVALLAVGTAANLGVFGLAVLGRTPWMHQAGHRAVVAQCLMVAACFPIFVYVRGVLRPFVRALGEADLGAVGVAGLRGRVLLLVLSLAALVALPSVSYALLQLDDEAAKREARLMRELAESLAQEAGQMGLHAFEGYLRSTSSTADTVPFVVGPRGRVVPDGARSLVHRARLPPPRPGRVGVARVWDHRHVVVSPVRLDDGRYAWAGVVYSPRPSPQTPVWVLALVLAVLGVALCVALVVGSSLAREIRAVSERLGALASGGRAEALPGDVGATQEIGRLVDGINALLAATDSARLQGFVQTEQSQEAARSKVQFLANMSHDLRSPLTAIIGFSEFLAQGVSGKLNGEQQRAVDRLLGAAQSLQHTIGLLLDSAKLEAGRMKLRRSWTPASTLVSRAVEAFVQGPEAAGDARVKVEVDPGLPPVHVDPELAARALALLLGALRASRADAQLVLRSRAFRDGARTGVEMVVGDRGGPSLKPVGDEYFSLMISDGNVRELRLGPYVAASLIRRQRGTVRLLHGDPGMVGFRISFPLALTGEMPALRDD